MHSTPEQKAMTDKRWSVRKPISLDIMLYKNWSPIAACEARNVGLEGLFLETCPIGLALDDRLEVEFLLNDGQGERRYRLPVLVRHVADDGIGIMFACSNTAAFRLLHGLLYGSRSVASLLSQPGY